MRRSAFFILLLAACSSDSADSDSDVGDVLGDSVEETDSDDASDSRDSDVPQSGTRLTLDAETQSLTLWREDIELVSFDEASFQLGFVRELSDTANYDPYGLFGGDGFLIRPPVVDHWAQISAISAPETRDDETRFVLTFDDGSTAELLVGNEVSGRIRCVFRALTSPMPVAWYRIRPNVESDENFYGLGEVFDSVSHRGFARAMQLELDPTLESSNNEAHVPVPFLLSTKAWGIFVENLYPGVFDVAKADENRVDIVYGTGAASDEGLVFHLFTADHPLDLTKHYYEVTGYPKAPAPWALGPWVWRDENRDQAQVLEDIRTIRELDLPTTAIWIDRPYATGVNTFDFDAEKFPTPAEMISEIHALGFRVAVWHTPYLDESDEATAAQVAEAESAGYYPPKTALLLNGWGRPIDFTNPAAYAWWQAKIEQYAALGIEGYKLDYAEDIVVGVSGSRNVWEFFDGSDERTMHALYQKFYHRIYSETLPETGGFLLCRGGMYGDQVNVSVVWPGDLDANFARHGERVTDGDDSYVAVGGVPAALIGGLSLGPSGFPLYGSDTGGYRHSPPDKETFVRWFQITALSPVMQIGTSTNDVAWEPTTENGFDAETLDLYREFTRLHLRLFPYIWSYFQAIYTDGRAIARPLGLAYPELNLHPSDQFLLGDNLMVAPVLERGVTSREVIFPPGTWINWFTGEQIAGGSTVNVDAPLSALPLYLRAGGIVPLLRPTIESLSPTTEPELVDTLHENPGMLYVRTAPGPDSEFRTADGSEIAQASASNVTTLSFNSTEYADGAMFEVYGASPVSVQVAGAEAQRFDTAEQLFDVQSGWTHNGMQTVVRAPAGSEVRIEY